jgi:hypothetical protein
VPAVLDAIVVRALDADPARRYANGNAMADALESFVVRPDPASATVATDSAMLRAATGAGASAGSIAAIAGAVAAPMQPPGAVAAPGRLAGRRGSPVIAGPLAVLSSSPSSWWALLVAALPGGDTGGLAVATTTPARPARRPRPRDRRHRAAYPEADRAPPPPPRQPRLGSPPGRPATR